MSVGNPYIDCVGNVTRQSKYPQRSDGDPVPVALPLRRTGYGEGPQLLGGVGKNITSITMAVFCGFEA